MAPAYAFEEEFETAVKNGTFPGAVLVGSNREGNTYTKSFGPKSLDPSDAETPLSPDAIMWFASCTKLVTSVAILQLVEQGKVAIEDEVTTILPDLAKLPILTGFTERDEPVTKKRQNPITLRSLLVHSSGQPYPEINELLAKYRSLTKADNYSLPLVFEPTTDWLYGVAIDWVGKLVEELSGQTLEEYFKQNIFSRLGIDDITFWPTAEFEERRMGVAQRTAEGTLRQMAFSEVFNPKTTTKCWGGHGLFGASTSYIKILQSLLLNDGKLLKPETADLLFKGHLLPNEREVLQSIHGPMAGLPAKAKVDWGLGGLVLTEDDALSKFGWNGREGALYWGGVLNHFWFIDRRAGICGVFGTQVDPFADPKTREMINVFKKGIYEVLGNFSSS